ERPNGTPGCRGRNSFSRRSSETRFSLRTSDMRPFFPVLEQAKEYVLEAIHSVRAFRLVTYLTLKGKAHTPDPVEVVVDTGAPFSVLPYNVWAQGGLEFVFPPGRSLRPMASWGAGGGGTGRDDLARGSLCHGTDARESRGRRCPPFRAFHSAGEAPS